MLKSFSLTTESATSNEMRFHCTESFESMNARNKRACTHACTHSRNVMPCACCGRLITAIDIVLVSVRARCCAGLRGTGERKIGGEQKDDRYVRNASATCTRSCSAARDSTPPENPIGSQTKSIKPHSFN